MIDNKIYKILFVCHGNICRSAMAEFIMKALVKTEGCEELFHIESAAVSAEETGNGIYPTAKRCLTQHGIVFDHGKTARQVRPEDYRNFDLMICMDASNLRRLYRIVGDDPKKKIHTIMSFTPYGGEVADPWYTGDFERTFQDLLIGCQSMLKHLLGKIDL